MNRSHLANASAPHSVVLSPTPSAIRSLAIAWLVFACGCTLAASVHEDVLQTRVQLQLQDTLPADADDATHGILVALPENQTVVRAWFSGLAAQAAQVVAVQPGRWRGRSVARVQVRLAQDLDAVLHLETRQARADERPLQSKRPQSHRSIRVRQDRAQVINPETWALQAPLRKSQAASVPDPFQPTSEPSTSGSAVRHLIITTEELAPAFEELARWRTRRGLPSQVRTLEWITTRTRQGIDLAETLRNFLIDAYEMWGVEYVLLGGDSDVIPPRYGRSLFFIGTAEEYVPSDLYYASLDGTWNDDGDAYWGEGEFNGDLEEGDLFPEVTLGRAPVSTLDEANLLVQKIKSFELPVYRDYQEEIVFLHEVLSPANWDSGQTVVYDGAQAGEFMVNSLPPGVVDTRVYDTWFLYPGTIPLNLDNTIVQLNEGAGVVNHLGHGYRYNMSVGDVSLVNADADLLSNTDRNFLLLMSNCTAVAFDFDCLAEHYLANPGGGAAGVIGAARSVGAFHVVLYNQALIRQLYEYDQIELGSLLDSARLERTALAGFESQDRHLHFSLNALGDPAMRLFNAPVASLQAAHVDTITADTDSLSVLVWADSLPLGGATIVAFKEDEVYSIGTTDTLGTVSLPIAPRTPGPLYLNILADNVESREDTLTVLPSTPALLRISHWTVNDDTLGMSHGNADGLIDAGETIEIQIIAQNTGGTGASDITAFLTSADTLAQVLSDTLHLMALDPGAPQLLGSLAVVHIDAATPDGRQFPITVHWGAEGGQQWTSTLSLQTCAPRPELLRTDVQAVDSTTTHVWATLKNYGSGSLPPTVATLTSLGAVSVLQDSAGSEALAAFTTTTLAPHFVVDASGGVGSGVVLDVDDAYGRRWSFSIDLTLPAVPGPPVADATFSSGVLRLSWTPAVDTDHRGYHVFRAPLVGSFTQLTPDIIHHADYRDTSALPNSQYNYYVVSVDSSSQWSEPSDTTQVNTTAAVLPGWPLQLEDPTASSVAVGDIDGDAEQEIVVGAVGVYAWHTNGLEVTDGDDIPATFGILSTLPGEMNASIALGEFNGQVGLDIVAAPWLSNAIHVFDGQGDLLPGWPQEPANGGNAGYWASPAVGDIDNDGDQEITAISKDGWLYAWHHDGAPLIPATDGKVRFVGAWTQNTPALADLDTNGDLEIIVAASSGSLLVVGPDGTDAPGWPVWLQKIAKASPAVGDVDDDGVLEIVVTSQIDLLHVYKPDGSTLSGFPVNAPSRAPDFGPSPALGDLDGDGKLEIVVPVVPTSFPNSELRVYDYQGNIVLTKALGNYTQSSPVLADLDGDGSVDIVQGGESGVVYAWDSAGNDLPGFPIATGDFARGTPTYTDVDFDGNGDLVFAGWNRDVVIWRMTGAYRKDTAPWPTFHGDVQRRGALALDFPTHTGDTAPPAVPTVRWAPNPFNPQVTLQLQVPGREAAPVVVDLFDIRGRRVRELLRQPLEPGPHRIVWDGRDQAGRPLSSGVYLYRLQMRQETRSGKLTLLR